MASEEQSLRISAAALAALNAIAAQFDACPERGPKAGQPSAGGLITAIAQGRLFVTNRKPKSEPRSAKLDRALALAEDLVKALKEP